MPITATEIASANAQEALDRVKRIDEAVVSRLSRSIEINSKLRIGLEKAAQRFEAKGMQSDAYECRRVLREL
jgi:hypothetical protein